MRPNAVVAPGLRVAQHEDAQICTHSPAEAVPELIAQMPAWDGYTKVTDRDLRVFALERD